MLEKNISLTYRDLVIGDGEMVEQQFVSSSPDDTCLLAKSFAQVVNKENRLFAFFRLGLQGVGGCFDRSALGMSTFVNALANNADDYYRFVKGDYNQSVGYSHSNGVVTITDNKAGWVYPKLVAAWQIASRHSLVIEEHGHLGEYQFNAYVKFDGDRNSNDRQIRVFVDESLAKTDGYRAFANDVAHLRAEL